MFRSGYLTLVRWRGTPIRLHWSIPVGALVFGGFRFDVGSLLGFAMLVVLHELGHALMVWRFGHAVSAIEVTGLGGVCSWSGSASPFQDSAIAWGGALAQLVVFSATQATLWLAGPPASMFTLSLVQAFTDTNLWLMAINLLPIPPLDGASAWQIFARWRDRGHAGVPAGSWREPSRDAGRERLRRAERAASTRRRARRVASGGDHDDLLASGARPSDEAQRAIDALLRRATARIDEDDEKS